MIATPTTALQQRIDTAVGQLDRWLDTMRGPTGYTGPVAHWWQQRLTWTGTALDWRYEGIIAGYIQLWRRTGDGRWLAKAQWSGDDLLAGQSPSGHFGYRVAAEGIPRAGMAMCATALLDLALALHEAQSAVWQPYAAAGELTIHGALIGDLWDGNQQIFRDAPPLTTFLSHRTAAICEALFRHAELRQETDLIEGYALPALRVIKSMQVRAPYHPLDGAIPYQGNNPRRPDKYLPLCTVRCIPVLLQAYDWTHDPSFFEAAWRAFAFVQRYRNPDGSFPAVIYANGRVNQYPQWIAGTGEVIRAAQMLREHGVSTNVDPTLRWLLAGQDGTGGIRTARGFGARVFQRDGRLPDVRDLLHVVGWCDKAFRALTFEATGATPQLHPLSSEHPCAFRGRYLTLYEDTSVVEIVHNREVRYRWRKGDDWPTICAPEFVLT